MSKRSKKPKTSRSIVSTLVIAFLALTLTALLITNLSVFFFFGQAIQESVDSRQQLVTKEAANTVSSFVQEKFSELEATAKIGEAILASPEEQRTALGNLLGLVPAFRQVVLFDSQDQELAQVSRLSEAALTELAERLDLDLFLQMRQGTRYVSPVYVDDATSEPLVIIAVPVFDTFGDFQGTLLAEVNLKFMWDLVDRLQVGESGVAYVVDKDGNLLAFGDTSRVLRGDNIGQLALVDEFMHNPVSVGQAATSMIRGINGTTVVGTYVPLGLPDWAVVAELPIAEAFRPGIQSSVILGSVMLVVAVLVGMVAVYIARRLAAPLLDLTATAGRIADGEFDLQAPLKGSAEIVDLARAFNVMTTQLREFIGTLEDRVAQRTSELEHRSVQMLASAQVAREAAAILDVDQLLEEVVHLISERFGFYHAGLFLVDDAFRYAVLRAASSEGGQRMLARGHRLRVGAEGVVGYAADQGEARIALDVGVDARYFDNPDLPLTRSEVALPLVVRQRVIGVLDVQSTEEAAFDEDDVAVLQAMADQVAVALENARLLVETEDRLRETRVLLQRQSQEGWTRLSEERPSWSYMYDGVQIVSGQSVDDAATWSGLKVPVQVRNQTIGYLNMALLDRIATQEDELLAQAVADQVGQALESARLYQDTQRRAVRERRTAEITARVRGSTDVDAILRTALRELGQLLGASDGMIWLEGGNGLEESAPETREADQG